MLPAQRWLSLTCVDNAEAGALGSERLNPPCGRCPNSAPDLAQSYDREPRHCPRRYPVLGDMVPHSLLEGCSILLVKDDPTLSDLKTALGDAGAVITCADLARALVYVERPFLSAAILDCAPASRERRDIIRRLRDRHVPFLIYSTEPPGSVAIGQGAPFVPKPSPTELLVSALAALMSPIPRRG